MISVLKRVLPSGKRPRRILFGPAAGSTLLIDLHHSLRLWFGVYERELWSAYRSMLRPGMNAFDIGGRDGYSALLINRLTGASVVSFECDQEAAAEMKATFALNVGDIRVRTAFVGPSGITLDAAADEYFIPDFVKIDVEGGEADVLESGRKLLAVRKPALIVETHGRDVEQRCVALLRDCHYTVEVIDQARFFKEHRPLAHNRWILAT